VTGAASGQPARCRLPQGTARLASPALLIGFIGTIGLSGCAAPADEMGNWFNDPFFQISAAIADCPPPAGPFVPASERVLQTHRRAEKGTTCWLARECERPTAYAYDADIAAAAQAALRQRNPFAADTSLWVTVQGRVVYIEGCARDAAVVPALEAFARAWPDVQQAIAIVRIDGAARPPYRLRTAAPAAPR